MEFDSSDFGDEVVFWHGAGLGAHILIFCIHLAQLDTSKFGWESWTRGGSWLGGSLWLWSISVLPIFVDLGIFSGNSVSLGLGISGGLGGSGVLLLEVDSTLRGSLVNFGDSLGSKELRGFSINISGGLSSSGGSSSLSSLFLGLGGGLVLSSLDESIVCISVSLESSSGAFPLVLVNGRNVSFSLDLSLSPSLLLGGISLSP